MRTQHAAQGRESTHERARARPPRTPHIVRIGLCELALNLTARPEAGRERAARLVNGRGVPDLYRHHEAAHAALPHAAHAIVDASERRPVAYGEDERVKLRGGVAAEREGAALGPRGERAQARVDKVALRYREGAGAVRSRSCRPAHTGASVQSQRLCTLDRRRTHCSDTREPEAATSGPEPTLRSA